MVQIRFELTAFTPLADYTLVMRIVAVIPARGGSKGIPRKNLRFIGSQPLVSIKIGQAIASRCSEVYVSTEDSEVAKVSMAFGAEVINRPWELAKDESGTDSVLLHAIRALSLKGEDILVLLQATSPFLNVSRINECIYGLLNDESLSSVMTIRYGHPFMWKLIGGRIEPKGHSRKKRPRRQELGEEGWETGGCYAIRVSALTTQGVRYPKPTAGIGVNQLEALDIDTMDDLILAQQLSGFLDIFAKPVGGNELNA